MAARHRAPAMPSLPPGSSPPPTAITEGLLVYKTTHALNGKGQIATMIYASRLARRDGLPFNIEGSITTEGQGQVRGLGKSTVQAILKDYGIKDVLAEEGGRTSRGSLGRIRSYLAFLNELGEQASNNIDSIEAWWVEQAKNFFNGKPFTLRFEAGKSLRSVIRDLLTQAEKRQNEASGTMFVGAMLQHLIGAKLSLALPDATINHNGFSVADAVSSRSGDFDIGSATLHVTTAPGEAVIRKCAGNRIRLSSRFAICSLQLMHSRLRQGFLTASTYWTRSNSLWRICTN